MSQQVITQSNHQTQINMLTVSITTAITSFLVMMFITIPRVTLYSSGLQLPDLLSFGYSDSYLYQFISTIGDEGRAMYLQQLVTDLIYPFFLALSCYLGFKLYFNGKSSSFVIRYSLYTLSWLICVFDYLENLCTFLQIQSYPTKLEFIGQVAALMSMSKAGTSTIVFSGVLFVLLKKAFDRFRSGNQ